MKIITAENAKSKDGLVPIVFTEWCAKRDTVYSDIVNYLDKWKDEPFNDTEKRTIESELTDMLLYLKEDGVLESYSIDVRVTNETNPEVPIGVEVLFNWTDAHHLGMKSSTSFYITDTTREVNNA